MFGHCKSDPSIPIEHLDYKFIGSCKDIDKLQKIIKILRSGEEGIYPELTKFAEDQLRQYNPKNPLLEKVNPETNFRDLEEKERQDIVDNLKGLIIDSKNQENGYTDKQEDDRLPPIRSSKTLNVNKENEQKEEKAQSTTTGSTKRVSPRSYDEWSKLDKEIEANGEVEETVKNNKTKVNDKGKNSLRADEMVDDKVNTPMNGVSKEELATRAENEKNKGNEAFRSGDFKEALVYYNRSLELKPVPAVYNNRAMTHIKLENYQNAIGDCDSVLAGEPDNIKAFLRRGLAYQSLNKLDMALANFTKVVELEPKNKRGKELYESVYKELEKQTDNGQQKKGKRLIVEEISSEDTKENIEPSAGSGTTKKGTRLKIEEVATTNGGEEKVHETSPAPEDSKAEVIVPKELPEDSVVSKNEGNILYKNGQYQEAYQKYTFAIQSLMTDASSYKAALSSLFNNRAICQLKSGNCSECVKDCTKSLKYIPNVKAILRRATAYEHLEKYKDAYIDYQIAFSRDRDPKTSQAMARISNQLKADYGRDWHDKLPKKPEIDWGDHPTQQQPTPMITCPEKLKIECPEKKKIEYQEKLKLEYEEKLKLEYQEKLKIECPKKLPIGNTPEVSAETKSSQPKAAQATTPTTGEVKEEKPAVKETVKKTNSEVFAETKEKGNSCVKKGNYSEAIGFYTKCIELMPSQVPSYTNRALCYLKLKQPKPTEAIDDCSSAITLESKNIKALFRRAQGYKMLKNYKKALGDLATILKEEPKNSAAQKEMDECKESYRMELRQMQTKGKSKKMKIEEISSESLTKPPTKQTTKTDTCPMARGNSNSSTQKSSNTNSKKINGIEFMQMWNGIKSGKSADYAEVLRAIEPAKLPELLSNKIDGKILENFIRAVHDHFTSKDQFKYGMSLMKNMYRVQRFSTNLMFLSTQEMTLLKTTIDILENRVKQDGGERSLQNEINQLRSQYRCSLS